MVLLLFRDYLHRFVDDLLQDLFGLCVPSPEESQISQALQCVKIITVHGKALLKVLLASLLSVGLVTEWLCHVTFSNRSVCTSDLLATDGLLCLVIDLAVPLEVLIHDFDAFCVHLDGFFGCFGEHLCHVEVLLAILLWIELD